MKTEQYLLEHITSHNISVKQMEKDIGINMARMVKQGQELSADEFIASCIYLGIRPEELRDKLW